MRALHHARFIHMLPMVVTMALTPNAFAQDRKAPIRSPVAQAPDAQAAALKEQGDRALDAKRYEDALARFAAFVREIRGTDIHNVLLQCTGIVVALSGLGRDADAVDLHAAIAATMPPYSSLLLGQDLYPGGSELLERSRERLGPRAVAEAEQRGASRTIEDVEEWVVSMAPATVPV